MGWFSSFVFLILEIANTQITANDSGTLTLNKVKF